MHDTMSRRKGIKLMVAGSGAFIIASAVEVGGTSSTSATEAEHHEGILGRVIESNGSLLVETGDGNRVRVFSDRATEMISGAYGKTGQISDFIIGDTVVATGAFNGPHSLEAEFVASLFNNMEIQIESTGVATRGDGVEAPVASGVLPDASSPRVPADALRAGRRGTALTWTHPIEGTIYLLDFK